MTTQEYKLRRSGLPPLVFSGEQLAHASSHRPKDYLSQRWHEITLYQTDKGDLVLQVAFKSTWHGEIERDDVAVIDSPKSVARALRKYDPLGQARGFPSGNKYVSRQEAMETALIEGFQEAASAVLTNLPGAEKRI